MNIKYFRYFLLAILFGGGAMGLMAAFLFFPLIQQAEKIDLAACIGLVLMFVVFTCGIFIGVMLMKKWDAALKWLLLYFAIQIPSIQTPFITYALYSGGNLTPYIGFAPWSFGVDFNIASYTAFNLVAEGNAWIVGINILALAIFLKLRRIKSVSALYA